MSLFYRYDKEGPGVRKHGAKKRTFFVYFETLFRNFWKMIPTSFLYCVFWLIPVGFAAVGITYVTRSLSRGKHTFGVSDFFSTIKKNWKQAVSVGLVNNIITAMLLMAIYAYYSMSAKSDDILPVICMVVAVVLLVYFIIMKFYIWFMVITFNFSMGQLYKNAFKFVVINLPKNIVMLLAIVIYWGLAMLAAVAWPVSYAIISLLTVFFYPLYRYLLIQFCVFDAIRICIIDPYYVEHPDDDIEFRRNLGLIEDEDDGEFDDELI